MEEMRRGRDEHQDWTREKHELCYWSWLLHRRTQGTVPHAGRHERCCCRRRQCCWRAPTTLLLPSLISLAFPREATVAARLLPSSSSWPTRCPLCVSSTSTRRTSWSAATSFASASPVGGRMSTPTTWSTGTRAAAAAVVSRRSLTSCSVSLSRSREGPGGKRYYTLEALLFFIRNSNVSHASYVKTAAAAKIPGECC